MAGANDAARKWTDAELESLEHQMRREYQQAAREMRGKEAKMLERYAREKSQRERALDDTPEAREAHERWLRSQAAQQTRAGGMADQLAQAAHDANVRAADMVNDRLPRIYAGNANRAAFEVDGIIGRDTRFTLVDEDTVRHLMGVRTQGANPPQLIRETVWFMPQEGREHIQDVRKREIDAAKDIRWNRQKFASAITQGILQGESIPNIVKRTESIFGMNERAAYRAARTATTGAENAGRISSYERAARLGIPIVQEWLAARDGRTRDSHKALDGTQAEVGETFHARDGELRYPGDPAGPASEVYNCRCSLRARVKGYEDRRGERWSRLPEGMTYEEWLAMKPITRAQSYENGVFMQPPDWAPTAASEASGALQAAAYATPERIAELESIATAYDDEVERLARQSTWVPSEESIAVIQEDVDRYAAQMAENSWAKGFDIDMLRAESDRLYKEQGELWERRSALRREARGLEGAEFDKAMAEVERLKAEYDATFAIVDEVDRKIDALRAYERAEQSHSERLEILERRKLERETKLAAREENERLLAEARLNRNRAYGELSGAQPFAPHVRAAVSDEYADAMEAIIGAAESEHPEIAAVYRRFSSQMRVIDASLSKGGTTCYRRSRRGIFFNAEDVAAGSHFEEPYEVAFHEFAHLIDHVGGYGADVYASQFNELTKTIKKDWTKYRNEAGKRLGVTRNKNDAAIGELLDHGARFDKKKYGNVSDAIEGCTGKSYPLGIGHGAAYHDGVSTGKEFFAEVFDSAMANQASYNEMRRIFPNAVKMVEDMARELCS